MAEVGPPRPLAQADDRTTFDCSHESLNRWFQRHAGGNERAFASRTYVLPEIGTGRIVGYVSLTVGQIERAYLPRSRQRNMPDPVPILLLGQLAVDVRDQGFGHDHDLLKHAILMARNIVAAVGFVGVVTQPIDPAARAFYLRWGFRELPGDPKGALILPTKELLAGGSLT